ncbi:MAG: thiamine phosphate synthase [Desulfovibrionaceae bacterium]|nr:thiamine phosphate synthase [Desulfovibrionaceae bacterium]
MSKILPGETDLYALTDARLSRGRSLRQVVEALLDQDIRIIQYREKHLPSRVMFEECQLMRELTTKHKACFIVDDHVDLAIASHADGVHIGQDDLPIEAVRKLVGSNMLIGVSTHAPEQALAAQKAGADYIGVGPIFATKTKEDVCAPVGLSYLEWVVANITIPFVAIGGIKEHNIAQVTRSGAKCCALVSEFVGADNIGEKVQRVRTAMHQSV